MEINLNTGRVPDAGAGQPVARRDPVQAADTGVSLEGIQTLANSLNNVSLVRPDKVEHARGLVADVKYPPDAILDSIANLLAVHLGQE